MCCFEAKWQNMSRTHWAFMLLKLSGTTLIKEENYPFSTIYLYDSLIATIIHPGRRDNIYLPTPPGGCLLMSVEDPGCRHTAPTYLPQWLWWVWACYVLRRLWLCRQRPPLSRWSQLVALWLPFPVAEERDIPSYNGPLQGPCVRF